MAASGEDLLQALLVANWKISGTDPGGAREMPQSLGTRYGELPSDYQAFLMRIKTCVHPRKDAWFLGLQDFNGSSGSAFSWDEFEQQSLSTAEDDDPWKGEIKEYWDKVLPIALSVRSGYVYLGLRLEVDHYGTVVLGREPEFEEALPIAASFSDLCRVMVGHMKGRRAEALADFL